MAIPKTVPVTQLKRLGTRLPTFALPVTIPVLGGEPLQITLTCNALRKTEWAKVRDDLQRAAIAAVLQPADAPAAPAAGDMPAAAKKPRARAGAKAEPATATADAPSAQDFVNTALANILKQGHEASIRQGLARDVDLVLKFAIGWELEDEFSAENLQALEDEFGGSIVATLNAYDQAIFHGRLGN